MPFPATIAASLARAVDAVGEVTLKIPRASVAKVLQAVRTVILNWAMKLEADDILGEGLSFTQEEKEAASRVGGGMANFYGPIGTLQMQQSGRDSAAHMIVNVSMDTKAIGTLLTRIEEELGHGLTLAEEATAELRADLATAKAQLASPKPKTSVLRATLGTIQHVMEGAAGHMAGSLLAELVKIMAGLP